MATAQEGPDVGWTQRSRKEVSLSQIAVERLQLHDLFQVLYADGRQTDRRITDEGLDGLNPCRLLLLPPNYHHFLTLMMSSFLARVAGILPACIFLTGNCLP